jgi:soluble lytic murein transglycosylase-like protein
VGTSTLEGVTISEEGKAKDSATLNSSLKEFAAHLREQRAAVERIGRRKPADQQSSVAPQDKAGYEDYAEKTAMAKNLDPDLVKAVIDQESTWNPNAKPKINPDTGKPYSTATGLMQLVKGTAERFGVTDPTDPKQNIDAGTEYLRILAKMYGNDPRKMVAAYYLGEGDFAPYKNKDFEDWPKDARVHVRKVMDFYNARRVAKAQGNASLDKVEPGVYVDKNTGEFKDYRNPRKLKWGPDGTLVEDNG